VYRFNACRSCHTHERDGTRSQALSAERRAVIDARTDPNMLPMPPHITLEQAKSFFEDADRRFGIEGSSCARPRSN
jgi:hypothetical protein